MIKSKIKTITTTNKKTDIDSSDISSYNEDEDYENMTSDQISQKGKEKFFKTELMEKIIKYIKIDDSIKEKQKEIRDQVKCLKTQKNDMEKYIIGYLENINQEFVNIEGTAKLTKTVTTSKGVIKPDNIKTSVVDSIKKQNIKIDEQKINNLLEDVLEFVDKNRPIKTKTYIKRTKGATNKALRNIAKKQTSDSDNSDDEELPKFSSNKKK